MLPFYHENPLTRILIRVYLDQIQLAERGQGHVQVVHQLVHGQHQGPRPDR